MIKSIIDTELIRKFDKILVCVSGGIDSVVLLDSLIKLKEYCLTIEVAHVNHMMRGKESDTDEEFVEKLCEKYGIKYHHKRVDMERYATENKLSKEDAGRKLRYAFFFEIIKSKADSKIWKIALAHNLDDSAETILMRIIRGTGTYGLEGIKSKRGNIIRPLLKTSRNDIERYFEDNKLEFRQDKSNFENEFTRNKIRNELIPFIEKNFNPSFKFSLTRLSSMATEQNIYLNEIIEAKLNKICLNRTNYRSALDRALFRKMESVEQRLILRNEILRLCGHLDSFEKKHYDEFLKILDAKVTKRVSINGIICYNSLKEFNIVKKIENDLENDIIIDIHNLPEYMDINEKRIFFDIVDTLEDKKSLYYPLKYIEKLTIRSRNDGDRIRINERFRKVKDFFNDKKIDIYERDFLPIIEINGQIVGISNLYYSRNLEVEDKYLKIKVEELWTTLRN